MRYTKRPDTVRAIQYFGAEDIPKVLAFARVKEVVFNGDRSITIRLPHALSDGTTGDYTLNVQRGHCIVDKGKGYTLIAMSGSDFHDTYQRVDED